MSIFGKFLRIGEIPEVPSNVSKLALRPYEDAKLVDIGLEWQAKFSHLQITNAQPPQYYEEYFMTASYSEKMQRLQQDQVLRLQKLLTRNNTSSEVSVLEVGCGDGSFLKKLSKLFPRVVGIEASKAFAEHVTTSGLPVLRGYVGRSFPLLTDEKFDAFASRQVFEHLPDPLDCLLGIKEMLKPGAVGLIEVPNGYESFRCGKFYDIFPDHVQYYSVNSLVHLATCAGFNIIECKESFDGHYIEAWLRCDDQSDWLQNLNTKRSEIADSICNWISTSIKRDSTCVLYGCGAKALVILPLIGKKLENFGVKYVIDADPNKIKKYIPGTEIEVVSIDDPRLSVVSSVFILSLSYRDEVVSILQSRFPMLEQVGTVCEAGRVVTIYS